MSTLHVKDSGVVQKLAHGNREVLDSLSDAQLNALAELDATALANLAVLATAISTSKETANVAKTYVLTNGGFVEATIA